MQDNGSPTPQQPVDIEKLARAIRFAVVAIVLGLSYFSLRGSLAISTFGAIYRDMLGGKPLPPLTVFLMAAQPELIALNVLIPVVAVAMLFSRRLVGSFYVIGSLGFLAIVQFIVFYNGLTAPLVEIIKAMGGDPGR